MTKEKFPVIRKRKNLNGEEALVRIENGEKINPEQKKEQVIDPSLKTFEENLKKDIQGFLANKKKNNNGFRNIK